MNHDNEYDEDDGLISRTAQKKSMQIYIKMGEELLSLGKTQLKTIPLQKELEEALTVAKKIKVGNALKRQMSFIGKLIRNNNFEELQAALDHLKQQDTLHERVTKNAEKWRDRLIEDSSALQEFISKHPNCDRQKLNQLVRNTIKEAKTNSEKKENNPDQVSSKHKKILFKLLRDTIK
jgi:ribosome-associated protein